MPQEPYRLINSVKLDPSFLSLGFSADVFLDTAKLTRVSATLNLPGGRLLAFAGPQVHVFELAAMTMPQALPITAVLPALAGTGCETRVETAFWGGPQFPAIWFFFNAGNYARLNTNGSTAGPETWSLEETGIVVDQFLRIPDGNGSWNPTFDKITAGVHGIGPISNVVHCFLADKYAQHNFLNGERIGEQTPAREFWQFPAKFGNVDFAFYGTGAEVNHIFFVSGNDYVQHDTDRGRNVGFGSIDKRFPDLGLLMPRPQLLLVEDYVLETFAGPLKKGNFADSIVVEPRTRRKSMVVTTIQTAATTALKQNVIQSRDSVSTQTFHKSLDKKRDESTSSDSYKYRMDALFHGEAEATSLWGGEVDASLNVSGGSDQQRDSLATSVFETASQQLTDSTQTVDTRFMSQEQASSVTSSVFTMFEVEVDNSMNDVPLETRYFYVVEPYVTLMVLKDVRAAYTNGKEAPDIFPLHELPSRLPEVFGFIEEAEQSRVMQTVEYVRKELGNIRGANRQRLSILAPNTDSGLEIDFELRGEYKVDMDEGQTIRTKGLIKAAKEIPDQPTYKVSTFKNEDA
jgi:hypothetical protein